MAQLTVYLDSEVLNRIEAAAVKSNLSVSKWVREKLENALKNEWPASYFSLFGAIKDFDLQEAEEIDFEQDIKREKL